MSFADRLSFPAEDLPDDDPRIKKIQRDFWLKTLPFIGRFFGRGYTAVR